MVILGGCAATAIDFLNVLNDAAALMLVRGADFLSVPARYPIVVGQTSARRPGPGTGVRPAILRSCLTLSGDNISSASICIHQPQGSITRHAEEFGTLIIENRRIEPKTC
jgi:hypothetical protein